MTSLTQRMSQLSAAEDFFEFFGIPFEPSVVHVNRLHILKRFYQYLRREPATAALAEGAQFEHYKCLLERAYADFIRSTPAREKVFKVFQDAEGKHVSADSLRTTLPSHR